MVHRLSLSPRPGPVLLGPVLLGPVLLGPVLLALLLALLLAHAPAQAQDPGIARLARQLQSPDVGVRRQAAIGLGRASYPQSVRLLRAALDTEANVSIRLEIVRALRTIVFQRYPGYRQALAALGDAADARIEDNSLVRLRATEALWEASKKDLLSPLPFLVRNLSDPAQRLRLGAIEMLRRWGAPQAIDPLGRAALDASQSATVRLRAIEALGAISLADSGPVGRAVHAANNRTLGLLGSPPLIPAGALERRHQRQVRYLAAVADDPATDRTLALRAVKSIGQVKDKSSLPALRAIAETHRSDAVRKQATRVLSHVLARQFE